MLTNWVTLKSRTERLKTLEQQEVDGVFNLLPKKEASLRLKELEKLRKHLNGIKNMSRYLGFGPDWPYDYVQMNHWYTFEHRGKTADTWLAFLEEHPEVQAETEALTSCERHRSFAGRMIFNNAD